VLGTFDERSGELTLDDVPGRRKLSGKTHRNAAVAGATVKSALAGQTVFSVGYSDWEVISGEQTDLASYVQNTAVR
jgi:hypothetical protein